jgi:hypothetical protein
MNVLIACEESQTVCKAFRAKGHNAFSCDIQECSGGNPEWHIQGDVLPLLKGNCRFQTMNGMRHTLWTNWDLIIAHPPCTFLSTVATRAHSIKCTPENWINARTKSRIEAMMFFMDCINANCDHIAVENPVGIMNTCYRKADQIIEPWMFADVDDAENYVTKRTCLWLKGLPLLKGWQEKKPNNAEIFGRFSNGKAKTWEETRSGDRAKVRSKTFPGVAQAMAEQWG